jgi:predicted flap endonuclease-1-like 5' DNA nuclease
MGTTRKVSYLLAAVSAGIITACVGETPPGTPQASTLPPVPTPNYPATVAAVLPTVVVLMNDLLGSEPTKTALWATAQSAYATYIAPTPAPVRTVYDLNTAPREALVAIPGIGPAKAELIEAYRRDTEIKTLDDLLVIQGIGQATVNLIRNCACTKQR